MHGRNDNFDPLPDRPDQQQAAGDGSFFALVAA